VGLDIGATTPEGIALSIVGQIHAWLAGRAYSEAVLTSEIKIRQEHEALK
jgi:xanthine/CO dehydrogenase XdhC/CoxF family maturation factor